MKKKVFRERYKGNTIEIELHADAPKGVVESILEDAKKEVDSILKKKPKKKTKKGEK